MMEVHGKIYVVAAVLAIIFVGLAAFLFYLDNKLGRLEKKIEELKQN
jgi:CcmD family protein